MLETDLYNLLSTDANVLAALNEENNVYLGAVPKGQPDSPAVVIQVAHTDRYRGSEGPNRFTAKRVQFDSYHQRYSDCVAINNAIYALMIALAGSLATTQIQGTICTEDMDMGHEPGDTGYVFRRLLTFEVQHTDLQAGDLANTYTPSAIPAPGGNATLIEGIPVSATPPSAGQGLVYDGNTGQWEPGTVSGSAAGLHGFIEAPDGVRTIFTLDADPNGKTAFIYKNGELQNPGAGNDYTIAGTQVTFALAPAGGSAPDVLKAIF